MGVAIAAAILVGGRAASAIYADYTWYASLGAAPLWTERSGDLLLIYGIGSVVAVVVAFVNLAALGRSIGVLTLPRRLANVEFGEAVPRKYIDRFAFVLAVGLVPKRVGEFNYCFIAFNLKDVDLVVRFGVCL